MKVVLMVVPLMLCTACGSAGAGQRIRVGADVRLRQQVADRIVGEGFERGDVLRDLAEVKRLIEPTPLSLNPAWTASLSCLNKLFSVFLSAQYLLSFLLQQWVCPKVHQRLPCQWKP